MLVADPKPSWLRRTLPADPRIARTAQVVRDHDVHSVCEEALCPNRTECYAASSATLLLLGEVCTRSCRFCSVRKGRPGEVDRDEPVRVGQAVREMGLRYVVLTSVNRDDLPDGGAALFAEAVREVRRAVPGVRVEVLIPDFHGDEDALRTIVEAEPEVLGHNLETVARLTPGVRIQAGYQRSLQVLVRAKRYHPTQITKSAIMLGLGEEPEEIRAALADLLAAGVDILVLGQYLRPTLFQLPVARYIPPEEFTGWKAEALRMGFAAVEAGPYVRSSYRAERAYGEAR